MIFKVMVEKEKLKDLKAKKRFDKRS